ncbi:MAG: biopolymer transporter ExbD [Xanthomonadaceae bacterium]|nr:biopolymer transporter ExbD [Xanthomonadaceae bacterium]
MRIDAGRQRDEPEITLTSLIDVVFTLIIFFVVTTTFDAHSALQVNLPKASPEEQAPARDVLLVVVDAKGRYFVGANEVLKSDPDSLREAIVRVAGKNREQPVVLRADAMTPHQAVVTAMDVLGGLGFKRLSIATAPERGQ